MPETINVASTFAPSTLECPRCGVNCTRNSIRTRKVKDINLEGPVTLTIRVGSYKCRACQKYFSFQPDFAKKGKHYSKRAIEKARQAVVEDRTTFTGLGKRLERDFHIRPSCSTGYRWFHEAADQIDFEQDYERWAAKDFSGYLAIDELYDGFCVLVATDPVRDKTISVQLCNSASEKELRRFLIHLRGLGLCPKVIITDGSTLYDRIPQEIWPLARHQLCIFHLTRLVTKRVMEGVGTLAKELGKDKKTKKLGTWLWRSRYLFVTRPKNLTMPQRSRLYQLCSNHETAKQLRQFMMRVFHLFDYGQTGEEAIEQHMALTWDYKQTAVPAICKAMKHLRPGKFFKAIEFLSHPGCPRTTNHVERANRFYRKRAKSHYRNRTERSIWNMVKSDLMARKAEADPPRNELLLRKAS